MDLTGLLSQHQVGSIPAAEIKGGNIVDKEMNRFQKKHINKYLKENRMTLDEIQQAFLDSFTMNQLSNMEIASLLVSVMRNTLQQPANASLLREQVGIDPDKLGIDAVTEVMGLLAKEFVKTL